MAVQIGAPCPANSSAHVTTTYTNSSGCHVGCSDGHTYPCDYTPPNPAPPSSQTVPLLLIGGSFAAVALYVFSRRDRAPR